MTFSNIIEKHKYKRRKGGPGHYTYVYSESSGPQLSMFGEAEPKAKKRKKNRFHWGTLSNAEKVFVVKTAVDRHPEYPIPSSLFPNDYIAVRDQLVSEGYLIADTNDEGTEMEYRRPRQMEAMEMPYVYGELSATDEHKVEMSNLLEMQRIQNNGGIPTLHGFDEDVALKMQERGLVSVAQGLEPRTSEIRLTSKARAALSNRYSGPTI